MKPLTLPALFTAAVSLTASAAFAADGTFDRTLSINSGAANVSVATGAGYVHVSPGSDSQVHIVGHVHARPGWFSSDADAQAKVRKICDNPPIEQSGNTAKVGRNRDDSDLYRDITIDYDVTVPKRADLTASSGSGGVQVIGIDGLVAASTGSGDVSADGIGANSRLSTGSGSIRATNVHGGATVGTGSGSVQLGLTGAGDVRVQTGSGAIHVDGVSGGLKASAGSGSIEVAGNPTSEWRLDSGSGSVHVKVGSAAHFNLNAETGSGVVQVEQPILMQGALNKHHLTGAVNGGGATIRVTTGSGDVTVR